MRLRRANDRLKLAADGMGLVGLVPFICECADATCMEIVHLDTLRYENVRDHPRRFFTVPGQHTDALGSYTALLIAEVAEYMLLAMTGREDEAAEPQIADDL